MFSLLLLLLLSHDPNQARRNPLASPPNPAELRRHQILLALGIQKGLEETGGRHRQSPFGGVECCAWCVPSVWKLIDRTDARNETLRSDQTNSHRRGGSAAGRRCSEAGGAAARLPDPIPAQCVPTGCSCWTLGSVYGFKQKESRQKMEDHGKSDGWDEVLEEDDELRSVRKDPVSASFLSSGTSRRSKSEKKPRFSIRGYGFAPLDVTTENLCIGGQEGTSGVVSTKASQTIVAERLENVEKQTEDLAPEFALPTKKANTSVSELLENLQRRSGSSVRTPSSLNQHALSFAIREQEVPSGVPPTKGSQDLMAELLENVNKQTENLPLGLPSPTKKANLSVAELLEDLQGRSSSSVEKAALLHQQTRAKHWKSKFPASEKKTLAILGDRSIDSEDPLEHEIDGTSSEEEDVTQNRLTLVNKDEKQQTMGDLFQKVFNPTNMEGAMLPMRSTGAGNYGKMQQIMQMEKDRHAEFLRQYNREQGDIKGTTVQIISRSLEGKLTVCRCLFLEKSNFTVTSNASTDLTMDESGTRRTIIFSPKICDNVDLLVGNIIHIFPPWKEVKIQDEQVTICTYFSHHAGRDTSVQTTS